MIRPTQRRPRRGPPKPAPPHPPPAPPAPVSDERREYLRAYKKRPEVRAKRHAADARRRSRRAAEAHDANQFVAIDSEGFSFGEPTLRDGKTYRHHRTFLWGAGNAGGDTDWLTSDTAIPSIDIIEFLLGLPERFPKSIFVSFAFGYDAAQIFADLPYEKAFEIQRGYRPDQTIADKNERSVVFWKNYGFSFLKGKKLQLYEFPHNTSPYKTTPRGQRILAPIRKVLIYDVFGFFQSSFLKASKSMAGAVLPDEYDILFTGKAGRASFQPSDIREVKNYTTVELRVLSRMMTLLRDAMIAENIHLKNWFGAGSIAQALLKRERADLAMNDVKTRDIPDYQRWAHHAYFGGRIELLHQGSTRATLHGYDIASAYPAVMRDLPDMGSGRWTHVDSPGLATLEAASQVSLFHLRFDGPANAPFYPLPYRTPAGSILFPRRANGYYMTREAQAAHGYVAAMGGAITIVAAWIFEPDDVSARPFQFVQELFDYRASLPKSDIKQLVIKLGINSLYGKTAQAIGGSRGTAPTFASPWHAAAITAGTRARLIEAALHAPLAIVMFATDGIISTRPLPLDIPVQKTLGAWEYGILKSGGIFIQSGVYAISDENGEYSAKSRGFRPAQMKTTAPAQFLLDTIPPLWRADVQSLEFDYASYMTLGASIASRQTHPLIGTWVDGIRKLDLRGAGVKRLTSSNANERRRRATRLVPTLPSNANSVLCDDDGDLMLSAEFRPDWLEPELGEQSAIDDDVAAIFMGRFE